jgi:hypothetical protein
MARIEPFQPSRWGEPLQRITYSSPLRGYVKEHLVLHLVRYGFTDAGLVAP